jgi:hypothetical protein
MGSYPTFGVGIATQKVRSKGGGGHWGRSPPMGETKYFDNINKWLKVFNVFQWVYVDVVGGI